MKFKDIVYKITDNVEAPKAMGVIAADLLDWSISCKCYTESVPAVEKAMEICKDFDLNKTVANFITDEVPDKGFCKRYVYFFIIEVPEETDIVYYPYIPDSDHRHWINGKLAFIGNTLSVYTASLKKGYNIFCVEKFLEGTPFIRIQIKEDSKNSLLSLTENNFWYQPSNFELAHEKHIRNGEPFKFTLIPLDLINLSYDSIVKMTVTLGEKGRVLYERDVTFKRNYEIDLTFIPNMGEDECERLFIYFRVKDKNGKVTEKYTYLFRHDIRPEYIEYLKERASHLLSQKKLPNRIQNEINFYMQVLTDQITYFYFGRLLKQLLTAVEQNALNDYLYHPGGHTIYYFSNINNQYHYYYVVLPKNFDPSKKYPLLLTFQFGHVNNYESLEHTSNFSARFAEREGAIYADIGGDGCTMGSYLGELFLLAEIDHLIKHFPVDPKRVYAIANCAGNVAALNFVGTYPHLFAGLYTRSINTDEDNIKNLHNVNCMYVFSGQGSLVKRDEKIIKKNLKNVKFLFSNKYFDRFIDLILIQYTKPAIDLLMSQELNEYPDTIYYCTVRNRARRAYYIEIESIEKGKSFAEFKSEINEQNLVIHTKNCSGLKIKIPPKINKEFFVININGKPLRFQKYDKDEVYLKHYPRRGFEIVESFTEDCCYYRGTGLLDVYLSPMRTVNCDLHDDLLTNISNVFAKPATSTTVGLDISYPIISKDDIIEHTDCAFTIVDSNCASNETLDFIRSKLPIQMDGNGYQYKGNVFPGQYCIAQIIANPWHKDKSILYINTNNKELYLKNIITRKLMIPSYTTGFHPFLNGVALLFDGSKYFVVKAWNEDFCSCNLAMCNP